jgi:hypothetical protein
VPLAAAHTDRSALLPPALCQSAEASGPSGQAGGMREFVWAWEKTPLPLRERSVRRHRVRGWACPPSRRQRLVVTAAAPSPSHALTRAGPSLSRKGRGNEVGVAMPHPPTVSLRLDRRSTLGAACRSEYGQVGALASGAVPISRGEWALRSSRRDAGWCWGIRHSAPPQLSFRDLIAESRADDSDRAARSWTP